MNRQMREGGDFFGSILKLITLFLLAGLLFIWVIPNLPSNFLFYAVNTILIIVTGSKLLSSILDNRSPVE